MAAPSLYFMPFLHLVEFNKIGKVTLQLFYFWPAWQLQASHELCLNQPQAFISLLSQHNDFCD